MSDIIDRANKQSQRELEHRIALARVHQTPPVHIKCGEHLPAGQAGICIDCEQPINPERAALVPDAPRCIYCQTDFEKQEKHFA